MNYDQEVNNNNNFVNFFSNESQAFLNNLKQIKTNENFSTEFTNFMKTSTPQQKNDLLTFIFNLSLSGKGLAGDLTQDTNVQVQNAPQNIKEVTKNSLAQFEKMKVPELKAFCKKNGLKVGGTKWDLIHRIQISQINFDQFDSSYIEQFKKWAGLFMNVSWNEGCLCQSVSINRYKKTKNDKTLLDFVTRIVGDKDLYFTEDAIIDEVLEERNIEFKEEDWPFADSFIDPKTAILAWILSFDFSDSNKRRKIDDDDDDYENEDENENDFEDENEDENEDNEDD
jgi:hypothetical protein